MARDWRRAVLAAFAAAMLGGACALGANAQPADGDGSAKAAKRQDPAAAQRAIEAALKQLEAGRTERAVQALSATLAAGNLPPAIMAKALYVRGMAYRQQGQPAQAISDFSSALWLRGGLGGDDRAGAIRERSAAFADAGLADPKSTPAPAAKTVSSGSNWLSNLFGGAPLTPPPAPPPAPRTSAAPPERVKPAAAPPAPDTWSSNTEVHERPRAAAAAPRKAPPVRTAPSAGPAEGRYLVQLAAVRTEAQAQALAAKAKRKHAAILASRGQSIDRAVFGNMGAFYRVRFGPFASAQETKAVCAKLQGSGLDCLPVTQ